MKAVRRATSTSAGKPSARAARRPRRLRRTKPAIENAPFLSGDPTGTIAGPMEFRDIYEVSRASRPWFVSDPPDGKIPALVPGARERIARRPATGSSFSNGVYESYESLGL